MRKLRQRVATALIVAMAGTALPGTAFADEETVKTRWQLEDGEWHYYGSDGDLKTYQYRVVNTTWYAFDDTGRMYENELFVGPGNGYIGDDEDLGGVPTNYAFPSGKLAEAGKWVLLNHDGTLHEHDEGCGTDCDEDTDWYYFEEADLSDGGVYKGNVDGADYKLGQVAAGKELTSDPVYGFDRNGVMFSRQWVKWTEDDSIEEVMAEDQDVDISEGGWHFYNYQGQRVTDQWRPVNGVWYRFDENGDCEREWLATASDATPADASSSIATLWMVDSVSRVSDRELEAKLDDEIEIEYKVNLATSSNSSALSPVFKKSRHDIWVSDAKKGSVSGKNDINVDEDEGIITVTYNTSPTYIGEDTILLVVDGVEAEPVTIVTKVANTGKDSTDAAGTILDQVGTDEISAETIKNSLVSVYMGTEDDTSDEVKAQVKEQLMKDSDTYEKLASQYATEMKITDAGAEVAEETQAQLDGEVTVIGASLNAGEGDTVQLKVAQGDAGDLADQYEKAVAFDITYHVNDEEVPQLDLPVIITMPIPTELADSEVKLIHIHEGETEEVDADINYNKNTVTFAADKFSDYVFVKTADRTPDPVIPSEPENPATPANPSRPSSSSGSSGGGGGSSTSTSGGGSWILDEQGWWFKNPDGSYPVSTWRQLAYNNRMDWYRFDQNGYMISGWYTDTDGRIYYLNPVSDGFKGAMMTGWQQIDGFWYYFNTESDGFKGALLVNTTTPDGYQVNGQGQRIE